MSDAQVRRLPVIDDQERLCGIVSLGDLSREAEEEWPRARRSKASAQPGGQHQQADSALRPGFDPAMFLLIA